ncbi:MAG: AAA family ATPase [Lachnospiraceae bacterium]|nr:AAA family ATPase [Lachnospiraceae bacterium]
MVIEKDRIFAENSNRTHGYGNLNLNTFEPFPKNPAISKVFREIGLADELGSGMRNTYKFTKLYSGGIPQFVEGDVFKTVIPLNETATMKSGPKVSDQVSDQVGSNAVTEKILEFCKTERTKKEISEYIGYKNLTYMTRTFLKPLLESGKLAYTIPEKLQSRLQKYITKR